MKFILPACALALAMPAGLQAQTLAAPGVKGVRLDVVSTGEVARTPDLVTIMAGVTTRAPQAEAALRDNAVRMERVRDALRRLGIAPRDIQTGSISLHQDFQHSERGEARPIGYVATNQLSIRFRDIERAGPIIDALVAQGVNNVNGPAFGLEDRDAALDEARAEALRTARQRADLYARALGTRVRRIVSVSESGQHGGPIMVTGARVASAEMADTRIEPGEQRVAATLTVSFELEQPRP